MLKRDKKTTILLTGASGFIGKYLLDILLFSALGHPSNFSLQFDIAQLVDHPF